MTRDGSAGAEEGPAQVAAREAIARDPHDAAAYAMLGTSGPPTADLSDGARDRYLLLGRDGEAVDAHGREFDLRGLSTKAALHWSWVLGERVVPFDLRSM